MSEVATLLLGISLGCTYALLVMGIVVTYRMSNFLNIAHGALAVFYTYLYWQLTGDYGINKYVAGGLVLFLVAPLVGALLGTTLFRSLSRAREAAKVAAAVAVIIIVNEGIIQIWGGGAKTVPSLLPASPVHFGSRVIGTDQLLIIVLAGLLGVGTWVLFARSPLGLQMRAIAEDRGLAAIFSVNTLKVEGISWGLASVLAALAGMLIAPLGALNPFSLTFLVIVVGLAAATVGRLVSIPGAFAGALALGVGSTYLAQLPTDITEQYGSVTSALPFVLLIAALAWFIHRGVPVGPSTDYVDQTAGTSTRLNALPGTIRIRPLVLGASHRAPIVAINSLLAIAFLVFGMLVGDSLRFTLTSAAVFVVVFSSMSLLNGLGGQISLCQATFMGVGALVAARFQATCRIEEGSTRTLCEFQPGWRVWVGFLLAALVAAGVGVLVAAAASRVRGVVLAVATLSFAFFIDNTVFISQNLSRGVFGIPVQRPPLFTAPIPFFLFVSAWALLSLVVVRNITRSPSGRVLRAMEQSPAAVEAFGVVSWQYRLTAFALSAAMAGVGGYLFAMNLGQFAGVDFAAFISLVLFVVMFAVGARSVYSPVIAALAYVFVPRTLNQVSALEGLSNLVFGVVALLILAVPGGVSGMLEGLFKARSTSVDRSRAVGGSRTPSSLGSTGGPS